MKSTRGKAQDPIPLRIGQQLIDAGVATEDGARQDRRARQGKPTCRNFQLAIDETISPRMDLVADPDAIADMMFTNGHVEAWISDAKPDVNDARWRRIPRVQQIAKKDALRLRRKRQALVSKNKVIPAARRYVRGDCRSSFYKDPTLVAYGEDNARLGRRVCRVTADLPRRCRIIACSTPRFPKPQSSARAVGYAMAGGRAIVELMYCDFLGCAGDEVFNQMAKWQAMSADVIKMPVVLRVSVGSKYGAQHSQDWSSLTAHIPGLKIAYPGDPV